MRTALALLFLVASAASARESLAPAAEYYSSHHDYKQAFLLWQEVARQEPENIRAALKVAELRLLYEGRDAARDGLLAFLRAHGDVLEPAEAEVVRGKIRQLGSLFLTDDGQSLFLQAEARVRSKDLSGAVALLQQAAAVEKGNLRVLKEKAKAEMAQAQFPLAYETWKLAALRDPFDSEVLDTLSEAHISAGAYAKAIHLFDDVEPRTPRQQIALAAAYLETGSPRDAQPLLQSLLEKGKQGGLSPIVYALQGEVLAARRETLVEALAFLTQFDRMTEKAKLPEWDPYKQEERRKRVKTLIASLRSDLRQ